MCQQASSKLYTTQVTADKMRTYIYKMQNSTLRLCERVFPVSSKRWLTELNLEARVTSLYTILLIHMPCYPYRTELLPERLLPVIVDTTISWCKNYSGHKQRRFPKIIILHRLYSYTPYRSVFSNSLSNSKTAKCFFSASSAKASAKRGR